MTLPTLTKPGTIALFLDFDGTLVEIAERPDAVVVAEATRTILTRLQGLLGGALAIVTGREIETIDEMLSPFRCPVAGVHGLTRRDSVGRHYLRQSTEGFSDAATHLLMSRLGPIEGLIIEKKQMAIALHYRARPELEAFCLETMEEVARLAPDVLLVRGKMVIEARPSHGDKGTAIEDFLAEPPFAGRIPVFAGDDVTDEDAFRTVTRLGGIALKIGAGDTSATYSVPDTQTFLAWLALSAATLEKGAELD